VACGGGGGGGNDPTPIQQPPDPPDPPAQGTSFTLSGTAIKGVIAFGVVNVYASDDLTSPIFVSPETTDANGVYTLTVPADAAFASDLVVVEVVAAEDGSSTMICDANVVVGCIIEGVSYEFGEVMPLPPGFSLRAGLVAPGEGESIPVHLNTMTELALKLADATTLNGLTFPLDEASLDLAYAQLATLLNIDVGDFASVAGIDLSSPTAREGASEVELKVAIISAALLAVALEEPGTLSTLIAASTDSLATKVAAFAADSTQDEPLAELLADVLEEAAELAGNLDKNELAATLLTEVLLAESATFADLNPTPSPGEGLDGLEQAKLFVADLRNVRAAFREEELQNDFDPLENALELANDIASPAAEDALRALGDAINAIEEAAKAYNDDTNRTSFIYNGIEVAIVPGADEINAEFSVTDSMLLYDDSGINTVSVSASAAGDSSTGDLFGDTFTFTGELNFTAGVSNSRVTLDVTEGFAGIVALDVASGADDVEKVVLRMSAVLAQLPAADTPDPVTFSGTIRASGINLLVDGDNASFGSISLAFTGEVAADTDTDADDSVSMTLGVVLDGTDFILGPDPIGTVHAGWATYDVEENGKVVTIVVNDRERPAPAVSGTARWEYLSPGEVDALGGLPPNLVGNPAFSGAALHLEVFDDEGNATPPSNPNFVNGNGVFLLAVEFFPLPISSTLDYLNQRSPLLTIFDRGVFERVPQGGEYTVAGGSIDLHLICTGFCESPPGSGEFFDIEAPFFLETRTNVLKGAFAATLNTDIIGIGDESGVDISIAGEKLDIDTFEVLGNLSYAGRSFDISAVTFDIERLDDINALTVSNQDGVVIDVVKDSEGNITGTISKDGEEFATIEEDVGDFLLIRYSDGTFESL
jgi:hypothetical protein